MTKVVKCRVCGLECNGDEATIHKKQTRHNSWDLILPDSSPVINSLGVENRQEVALDSPDIVDNGKE